MQKSISLLLILILALSSCKTVERTSHKNIQHLADTLAIQARQDSRVGDSLSVTITQDQVVSQRDTSSVQTTDQETELIEEEITTTTDSLGNTIRKEKRTTKRTRNAQSSASSSSFQQSTDSFLEELSRKMGIIEEARSGMFKATKNYNIEEKKEKTSKTSFSASFGWSLGVGITIIIICALVALYVRKRGLFK